MKIPISLLLSLILLGCGSTELAGTATDVNSGSISGTIHYDEQEYRELVSVALYDPTNTLIKKQNTTTGVYRFDSVEAGSYNVIVSTEEGAVVLGSQDNLTRGTYTDLPIHRIVQKSFKLSHKEYKHVIIKNVIMKNGIGKLSTEQERAILVFTECDTNRVVSILYEIDGSPDSTKATITPQDSSNYHMMLTDTSAHLELINQETTLLTGTGSDSSFITIDGIIK